MAATGYTPISLYYSTSAGVQPSTSNMVAGELALNITDGKLYYKDTNTNTIKVIAGAGGAGVAGGSNTQVQYNSSGSLAGSSLLTFDGTTLAAPGTVISVNTSTDALRITQTGSGNALLVEDSANPDSTPFVIDATGVAISGNTTAFQQGTTKPNIQIQGTDNSTSGFGIARFSNDSDRTRIVLAKSRGSLGSQGIVQSGDVISNINSFGSDGTNWIQATSISSEVDGTPGTNDMPGRLVFSTTADGASSPTERMRIDNAGNVGIGVTPLAYEKVSISGTLPTGSANTRVVVAKGTIPSGTTSLYNGFRTELSTAASAFTLANAAHFYAVQGTIGAGSAVTSQYGYFADSSLTGATNNYGFFGNIASGTGRYNFYAAGTAANYMAGTLQVAAVIESTSGGFKFPDGTTQTSAGVTTGKSIAMAMIFGF